MIERMAGTSGPARARMSVALAFVLAGCVPEEGTAPPVAATPPPDALAVAVAAGDDPGDGADGIDDAAAGAEAPADDAAAEADDQPDTAGDPPETADAAAGSVAPGDGAIAVEEPTAADGSEPQTPPDGSIDAEATATGDAALEETTLTVLPVPPDPVVVERPPPQDPLDPALYTGEFDGPIDTRLLVSPEIFQSRDTVRWNGQRTLAGIWIAHAAAVRPERVRIINLSTGRAADGAIFRRDRMTAETPPQISSEAAAALGMSVNRDADLVMVGLRLAEVPFVPPADPAAEPLADDEAGPETDAAAAPAAERAADPAPVPDAPAAADAEAETTPALPVPTATRETGAAATADEGDATPPATISATSGRPNVVIMGRRPDTEPLEAVDSATSTEPRAAAVPLLTEAPTSDDRPATEATAEPETLSETATDPGAAESEGAERSDPPATDPTAPPATTPRNAAAVAIDQPFLQVGIFAQPANAAGLVENLGAEGIRARGITFTQNGRQLTRVVAGPFGSEAERDRALDVIETLGIRDARPSNS